MKVSTVILGHVNLLKLYCFEVDLYLPERASFNGHCVGNSIHLSPLGERGSVLFMVRLKVSRVECSVF